MINIARYLSAHLCSWRGSPDQRYNVLAINFFPGADISDYQAHTWRWCDWPAVLVRAAQQCSIKLADKGRAALAVSIKKKRLPCRRSHTYGHDEAVARHRDYGVELVYDRPLK